jgi:hypothetical protein
MRGHRCWHIAHVVVLMLYTGAAGGGLHVELRHDTQATAAASITPLWLLLLRHNHHQVAAAAAVAGVCRGTSTRMGR